jgi:hypothetical protein
MTSPAVSARPGAALPHPAKVRLGAATALFEPTILRRAAVAAFRKPARPDEVAGS